LYLVPGSPGMLIALMVAFFTAVTLLEASLPALVSRLAPGELKGTALGAYSTCQFLGAFAGGVMGGWVHGRFGPLAVFALCAMLVALWLIFASTMNRPLPVSTQLLRVGSLSGERAAQLTIELLAIRGVADVVIVAEDGVAYLKVNRRDLDRDALLAYTISR
jgi:MFS family permease